MSRVKPPQFILDVFEDPRRRGILFAGCLALLAVGLVPRALSPGLPTAQEAIRTEPEIQNLFLLLAFTSTATIILGGLVSDIYRRRSLLVGGLAVMLVGATMAMLVDDGPVFYIGNFISVGAAGVVLAYGIGSVAVAYEGIPRATALGFVYAAFGAGSALSPALLTLFPELIPSTEPGLPPGFTFDTTLSYLLTVVASTVALWAAYRHMPMIPGSLPASRELVTVVAVWSLSILAIVSGVLGFMGPADQRLPFLLVVGGAIGLAATTFRLGRAGDALGRLTLDKRAVGAALAVGVAVGFAQAIPLLLLPVVFEYAFHYGTLFAILALAPFGLALVVAGPVTGILIRRFGPRPIMSSGTFALGAANVVMAVVIFAMIGRVREFYEVNSGQAYVDLGVPHYLLFIVPLGLIGAGFVLATTVRTAIVFASTSRGLPASAAAINEASVGLGSRIGIVAGTVAVALVAVASAQSMFSDLPADKADALMDRFKVALSSLGTPRFKEVYQTTLQDAQPIEHAANAVAYLDGVTVALVISGVVGLIGAGLAWILIGPRDPLETVFDMQDERQTSGDQAPVAPGEGSDG